MEIKNAEKFRFAKFRFRLRAEEKIYLPRYKGSALRGGFGNVFKKTVCISRDRKCEGCMLREKCVYSYIFETPLPQGLTNSSKFKLPYLPHPFILEPPLTYKPYYSPGEEISFNLILVCRCVDYLPYFVFVFEELGKNGIGRGRGKYELMGVDDEEGKRIYESGKLSGKYTAKSFQDIIDESDLRARENYQKISISFVTPTRVILKGRLTTELEFKPFITNLLRRISWLSQFHCDEELEFDYKYLISRAETIKTTERDFKWYDWERYSSKQDIRMKLGGFVGNVTFEGDLKEFIPFVKLGEYIHIGKNTSFGLGKYKIVEED